ncbi:hypothetical protein QJS04_geneDACA023753 [Acorus gramineus]|uniref:Endonuclease/exonuclease/phosphatase domain-containing protein n=1 Tax=Acorus gramineus TaxID=55184 RepID=A0AAV9BMU9_ACOGR|nr:hypothetical protein QJS04_geneDACA023753 [Acorus gramineus]
MANSFLRMTYASLMKKQVDRETQREVDSGDPPSPTKESVEKRKVDERVGRFTVSVLLEDTITHWSWAWTGVYGPNVEDLRPHLWANLKESRARWNSPWCIMGDFNVTRFPFDRNREGSISGSMEQFSAWVANVGLLDIPLVNQQFTWSNLRTRPSFARLDRVFIDQAWEEAFPLCILQAQTRICSDHSPLIFNGGESLQKHHHFKFENWWLFCDGFREVVIAAWQVPTLGLAGARKVAIKLIRVKHALKIWSKEQRTNRRNSKHEIAEELRAIKV